MRSSRRGTRTSQPPPSSDRTMSIELVPRRGTVPAPAGSHRPLHAVVPRVRVDPADRLRQRRQPAAGARRGAAAGDRHSALARRLAPPHRPPADDGKRAAGAGRGRRRLPDLTARARGHGLLGACAPCRSISATSTSACRLPIGASRCSWCVAAVAATAFFALMPALQATRIDPVRTMRGELVKDARPGPRAQRPDRRAGLRLGAAADLRRDLPAQRDRVVAIRSGVSHRRHDPDRHRQRAQARRDAPGARRRTDDHRARGRQAAAAGAAARGVCRHRRGQDVGRRTSSSRLGTSTCSASPSCAAARSRRRNATTIRWPLSRNRSRGRSGRTAVASARRSGSSRTSPPQTPGGASRSIPTTPDRGRAVDAARGHGHRRLTRRAGLPPHRHQGRRRVPADQPRRGEDLGRRPRSRRSRPGPADARSSISPGSIRTWA